MANSTELVLNKLKITCFININIDNVKTVINYAINN